MSVRDGRKAGFVWQSTASLDHLRKVWNGGLVLGPAAVEKKIGKCVYHALTEIANEDRARAAIGGDSDRFRTSLGRIGARAMVSAKSAARACTELERIHLLLVEADSDGENRPGRPSFYTLIEPPEIPVETSDRSSYVPPSQRRKPVQTPSEPISDVQDEGGNSVPTSPYKGKKNSKEEKKQSEPSQDIYDFWKSVTGRNGQTQLTEGRRRAIRARLREGRPPEFIKQAIANVAASDFHMKRGKHARREGPAYDDLTLICRNGEQLEQYVGMGGGEALLAPPAPAKTVRQGEIEDEDQAVEHWLAAKKKLREEVTEESFNTWVEPLEAAGARDGKIVLVDSTEQGGSRWSRQLRATLVDALGGRYRDIEIVDEIQLEYEAR